MQIEFKPVSVALDIDGIDINGKDFRVQFEPDFTDGRVSDEAALVIKDNSGDAYIAATINKNQALYLLKVLDAFINEKNYHHA